MPSMFYPSLMHWVHPHQMEATNWLKSTPTERAHSRPTELSELLVLDDIPDMEGDLEDEDETPVAPNRNSPFPNYNQDCYRY